MQLVAVLYTFFVLIVATMAAPVSRSPRPEVSSASPDPIAHASPTTRPTSPSKAHHSSAVTASPTSGSDVFATVDLATPLPKIGLQEEARPGGHSPKPNGCVIA